MTGDYIDSIPKYSEAQPGRQCVHCHRRCGTRAGGFARFGGYPVCSRPTEPDRPDCYREVYYRFHPLFDCNDCMTWQDNN